MPPEQLCLAASNKLKKMIGDESDTNIIKMLKKWHEDIDMESIRTYMRKFMRNSHLFQFCKLVTDLLELEEVRSKINK